MAKMVKWGFRLGFKNNFGQLKIFHPLDYRRHSDSIKNTEICRNRFLVVRKLGLMPRQFFKK